MLSARNGPWGLGILRGFSGRYVGIVNRHGGYNVSHNSIQKIALGRVVQTPGSQVISPRELGAALLRHSFGDWGDVDREDYQSNDDAVENGTRILSSYKDVNGVKFWIITEANRLITTILLPGEY